MLPGPPPTTSTQTNLNCIYLLQKRIVRLTAKAHFLTNTAPIFSQLKVLDYIALRWNPLEN